MFVGVPNPNILMPLEKMTITVTEGKKRERKSRSFTTRNNTCSRAA